MSLPSRATAVALVCALAQTRALALTNTLVNALVLALTTGTAALAAPPATGSAPSEGPLLTTHAAPLHHTPLPATAALTPATGDWRAANAAVAAADNTAHQHHPVSPNSRSAGDEKSPIPHSHPAKGQP
ncbi:hypothetical protein [Comamonas serinivorans]|uniref:hypothetical protein n=1 Tax=Comamonas serinivorans TaxID=1082851 RepID=UPI0012F8C065|nr:hypothetical protein [Comamonas serinivorans]